jgi:obg-like ATPase 1
MADAKKKGKKDAPKPKVLLGKPGNNVSIGIVGMPNIGKSSLFNLLSKLNVPAENYPFCTIDPSLARVPVPDPRMNVLVEAWKPKKTIPAVLEITDIAGLVKGASEGKGLGNEFLANIQQVDAIYHLTRAFKAAKIEHVEGEVDPCRDLEIISAELIAKDLQRVNTEVEKLERLVTRGIDKQKKVVLDSLLKVQAWLKEGKDIREGTWDPNDIIVLNEQNFLSAKPIVYLVNIGKLDVEKGKNKWFKDIKEWCAKRSPGAPVLPFSASFEQAYEKMSEEERKKAKEAKQASQLDKIITTGYHALQLVHYFTTGEDEVRAWTIRQGALAPQAAGVIHTDFEKYFISAVQYTYDDFVKYGSEVEVQKAGKKATQGKGYTVQDGDILFFHHNAGGANKKK